jgi:hypothetical protein
LQHVVPNSESAKELCLSDEDIKAYINDFLSKFHTKMNVSLEFFPYCLIRKKFYKNIGKFSFENEFLSNNTVMFDNWSE